MATDNQVASYFAELGQSVYSALETYSNVHRGSGHYSQVTTDLYEHARDIVLEYLNPGKAGNVVVFCSSLRAKAITGKLNPGSYRLLSVNETGLPLGVTALAAKKRDLSDAPFQPGGGTTRLIAPEWIVWARAPERFEAGTPSIINVIAFAKALQMIRRYGKDIFQNPAKSGASVADLLYNDELKESSGRELLDKLRRTLIGRNIQVPTIAGDKTFINLDYSASTPAFAPVWNTVLKTWQQPPEVQREIIRETRKICADFLGAQLTEYDVIFVSNTTEAINLVARNFWRKQGDDIEEVIVNTLLEHNSNDLPWRMIPGTSLIRIQINAEGFPDLEELEAVLNRYNGKLAEGKKRIRIVTVCGISNVLGIGNNLSEISRIVHRHGAQLLVDGAQMVAHSKVNIGEQGIDYFVFSAHKVYAPFGCGVLIVKRGLLKLSPPELENIIQSGEENPGGVAGLGKALVLLKRTGMDIVREEEQRLTTLALKGLNRIEGLSVYGIRDPATGSFVHKSGIIAFTMKGMFSDRIARELAEREGIGIRYGCHCAHILVKHILGVGPGLQKFQKIIASVFPKINFPGVARISIGIGNTEEDIEDLIRALNEIAHMTGKQKQKEVTRKINEFSHGKITKVYT